MTTRRADAIQNDRAWLQLGRAMLFFGMIMLIMVSGVWAMDVVGETIRIQHPAPDHFMVLTLWMR